MDNFPRTVTVGLSEEDYRKLSELAASHDFAPRPGTLARVLLSAAITKTWDDHAAGTLRKAATRPAHGKAAAR